MNAVNYLELSKAQLLSCQSELQKKYENYVNEKLKLDMSRGKPAGTQLDLVNGSVDHLYLNLDELYSFEVKTDSFRIDTEYLSGSKNVDFQADPQECRRILWNPLSEKAKLNLKMKNPSEILLRE